MSTTRPEKILLTGASGFLGNIIRMRLSSEGYAVSTLGRSATNDIVCDLAKDVPIFNEAFAWVIHNAGKAHSVPKNERQAQEFFNVNRRGTENLLIGLQNSSILPGSMIFISSVSVYGLTSGQGIPESHPLAAKDPYGKSKIEAEAIITDWCARQNVTSGVLRLPLLAGKNPPGNLGSMINGIQKGFYLQIAGSKARKSIVMAEDVAAILPTVAGKGGVFNLTDGYHPSFAELEDMIVKQTGSRKPFPISGGAAKILGRLGDIVDLVLPGKSPVTSARIEKIVSTLTFDDQKARAELNWKPRKVIDAFAV